jgi:hypothetical protein
MEESYYANPNIAFLFIAGVDGTSAIWFKQGLGKFTLA